jgi:hypothetical protein
MAKFKCLLSGNVIEFTNQVDIDSMVGHEGYVRLEEETPAAPVVAKKAGRPSKVVTEVASTEEAE